MSELEGFDDEVGHLGWRLWCWFMGRMCLGIFLATPIWFQNFEVVVELWSGLDCVCFYKIYSRAGLTLM